MRSMHRPCPFCVAWSGLTPCLALAGLVLLLGVPDPCCAAGDLLSWLVAPGRAVSLMPPLDPVAGGLIVVPRNGRPPEGFRMPAVILPQSSEVQAIKTLGNVPAFDWCYGCFPTAGAMLAGYYDRNKHTNMYAGPSAGTDTLSFPATVNQGLCPLTNAVWGANECPLAATHKRLDGRTIRGHVDDYWVATDSTAPDPYLTNGWAEHTWNDCTADFMGSSQSQRANVDGGTRLFLATDGSKVENYTGSEPGMIDAATGLRRFIESRGYTVLRNYNQTIVGWDGNSTGFSWANYKAQIDAGRPVILHAGDHVILGLGYRDAGQLCYVHDTWDHASHQMTWGGTYSSGEHFGVTVIELQDPVPPMLRWVGGKAYADDGVNPNLARPGSNFVFKVQYRSSEGRAAKWVRLYAFGPDGKGLPGSPFTMASDGTTNWSSGVVFMKKLTLSSHGTHSYFLLADDGFTPPVRRPANSRKAGPIVNRAPAPTWAGSVGYTSDGVEPDTGPGGTVFTFRVKYRDRDGDAPEWVRVQVWGPNGKQINGSPFFMAKAKSSTDWVNGVAYRKNLFLHTAGNYECKFSANDGYSTTYFPAVGRIPGPVVNGSGSSSVLLGGIAAQQVGEAVALVYSLSAPAEVQAEVLNIAGRLIAQVSAGKQEAGVQTLRWNGRNQAGSLVAAGVYLVRVQVRTETGGSAGAVAVVNLRR